MLGNIRRFLIVTPNFPSILPGFDTQPFYLLLLWTEYRFNIRPTLFFIALILLCFSEYFISIDKVSFPDLIVLLIFLYLMIFIDWSMKFANQLYNFIPKFVVIVVFLSLLRLGLPFTEAIFSPRIVVNLDRSFPFIFPEASFAAKTFFGLFIGFAISLGRVNWYLIAGQILTLSATGMALAAISMVFAIIYDNRYLAAKFITIIAMVMAAILLFALGNLSILLGESGGGRLFFMLRTIVETGNLWETVTQDQSFITRIDAATSGADTGDLGSMAAYALQLPISFSVLGVLFLFFVLIGRSLSMADVFARVVALIVIGYADSFTYPAVIFALTCRPYRHVETAEPISASLVLPDQSITNRAG